MVIRCANPKCSLHFKYQYVGRVFRLRLYGRGRYRAPQDGATRVEYFWLCASCSSAFTLIFDERRGVSLAPFGDTRDRKRSVTLIFDISTLHPNDHAIDPKGAGGEDNPRVRSRKYRGNSPVG